MNDNTADTDRIAYDIWITAGRSAAKAAVLLDTSPRTLMRRVSRHQALIEALTDTGAVEALLTPVAFRHLMVAEGVAPESLTPQRVYNWMTATRNPFPATKETGKHMVRVDAGREWVRAWFAGHADSVIR